MNPLYSPKLPEKNMGCLYMQVYECDECVYANSLLLLSFGIFVGGWVDVEISAVAQKQTNVPYEKVLLKHFKIFGEGGG